MGRGGIEPPPRPLRATRLDRKSRKNLIISVVFDHVCSCLVRRIVGYSLVRTVLCVGLVLGCNAILAERVFGSRTTSHPLIETIAIASPTAPLTAKMSP